MRSSRVKPLIGLSEVKGFSGGFNVYKYDARILPYVLVMGTRDARPFVLCQARISKIDESKLWGEGIVCNTAADHDHDVELSVVGQRMHAVRFGFPATCMSFRRP